MKKEQKDGVRQVGTKVKKWEGRWQVKGKDGKFRDRTRILGLCSKMTKTEAKDKRRRLMLLDQQRRVIIADDAPFSEAWSLYVDHHPQWSEGHAQTMVNMFKNHVLPELGALPSSEINRVRVQAILNDLYRKGYSKSIQQKVAVYIRAALANAAEARNQDGPPRWRLTIQSKQAVSKRFLTIDEITLLLSHAGQRDHLILRLLLVCGFRPSELFALRWNDVRGENIRIDERASRFPKKEGPTRRGTKTNPDGSFVVIPPSVLAELEDWRRLGTVGEDSFIFPSRKDGPLNAKNFLNRNLRQLGETAGVKKPNFQVMRRTCATWLQKSGSVKDAQAHLRHTTPTMTLRAYQHAIPESVREAVEKLDARLLSGVKSG